MAVILKNATFIDWRTLFLSKTNIVVGEGENSNLNFHNSFEEIVISPEDEIIDCAGKLVIKSFAVGHHHAYSALSRGMPPPNHPINNFVEKLKYIWWNLDKALDKDIIEASALATAIACAKSGATFAIDHHASPNYIEGSLNIIAEAFNRVGVGHLLCYEITDRDGIDKAHKGLFETEEYLKNNKGLVGLHASFTVGDSTLGKAVTLMQKMNSGIHVHVAEDEYDQIQCTNQYGKRVVNRLMDAGVLNSSKTILAHCLHINDEERQLIGNSPCYVVQNTESNLNNNVGYFNSRGLGDNVMLGTDGMHSDIVRSAQASYFVGQGKDQIDFLSSYYRFRKVHNYLSSNSFVGDGENNLVVLDYDSPTELNDENFFGHFIHGFSSKNVQHVISNGEVIVKDRIVQTVDEDDVLKYTKEQASKLWNKL